MGITLNSHQSSVPIEVSMQSVALPAGSRSTPLGTEADLARAAARSDAEAFGELYRRHGQSMWRLAQAVTPDQEAATSAVGDGFVRVLRSVRRRQTPVGEAIRPHLLGGTYRAALDAARRPEQAQRDAEATAASLRSGDHDAVGALAIAAFRSLPERWRAAVWLHEVEGFEPDAVAPVLGVSSAVAGQLTARGRKGLLSRFEQASMEAPAHLGTVLRPLVAAVPAGLEVAAAARWEQGVAGDTAGRWMPGVGLLSQRATRPLSIATAGVLALGLIGVGVLGQHTGAFATGSAVGPGHAVPGGSAGVVPLQTASPSGYGSGGLVSGYGAFTTPFNFSGSPAYALLGSATSAETTGYGTLPGGASSVATTTGPPASPQAGAGSATQGAAPGTPGAPATPGTPAVPGTPGTSPAPGTPAGSTSPPAGAPRAPAAPATVNVGPLAAVTPPSAAAPSANVSVLPNPSGAPAASVSVGACTQVNLGNISVPIACPAGTPAGTVLAPATTAPAATTPTTPPTTSPVGGLLGHLGL